MKNSFLLILMVSTMIQQVIAMEEQNGVASDDSTSDYDSSSPSPELTASPNNENFSTSASPSVLTASLQSVSFAQSPSPQDEVERATSPLLKSGHFINKFRKRSMSEDDFATLNGENTPVTKKRSDSASEPLNPQLKLHVQEQQQSDATTECQPDQEDMTPTTNAPKDELDVQKGDNGGYSALGACLRGNSPLCNIIGMSTIVALTGAGITALYNKAGKKRISKIKVAAALWAGTAVTMSCYYYGPTLCPSLFGGAEE